MILRALELIDLWHPNILQANVHTNVITQAVRERSRKAVS